MKSNKPLMLGILLYTLVSLIGISATAQTLTIKGSVTLNDKSSFEMVKVSIAEVDTAGFINQMTYDVVKGFKFELEDNKNYLIVVQKNGFQSKAISINTNHTSNNRYLYSFIVNLTDSEIVSKYPEQAGGIYYNKNKRKPGSIKLGDYDYYLSTAKK